MTAIQLRSLFAFFIYASFMKANSKSAKKHNRQSTKIKAKDRKAADVA